MTKRKTALQPQVPAAGQAAACTMADLDRAIDELGIDVPIADARLVAGRLELHLYGGAIVLWPPAGPTSQPASEPTNQTKEGAPCPQS